MIRHFTLSALFIVAVAAFAPAQDRISGANYPLAQKFNKDFVAQHVQEASIGPPEARGNLQNLQETKRGPQWIGKTDIFWYSSRTTTGNPYWKVDPAKKEKVPLFDHVALAAALS